MFETSLAMMLPATIASLPRVFLTPVIPGWVGPDRSVRLPLMLDANTVDTGIDVDDDLALTEWVNARKSFFASEHNDFDLYPTEDAYEAAIRPEWLKAATKGLDDTIRSYAKSLSPTSPLRNAVNGLQNRWSNMQPVVSSLLYIKMQHSPRNLVLTPQDLALYGEPLEAGDLRGLIDFLETVTHIDDLMQEGMTDRIVVENEDDDKLLELHDVFKDHREPWLELYDAFGKPLRVEKQQVRPTCTYLMDEEGKIDPLATGAANVHNAYDAFQREMLSRNVLMSGAYLLAHFRFDDEEVGNLQKRLAPIVAQNPDLMDDAERSIVFDHLRRTGRSKMRNTEDYALLLAKIFRKLVHIS